MFHFKDTYFTRSTSIKFDTDSRLVLQCAERVYLARKIFQQLKRDHAATRIQSLYRVKTAKQTTLTQQQAILKLQELAR